MPLVTLTIRQSRSAEAVEALAEAVLSALVKAGYPADDRFLRVLAVPDEALVIHPTYPDAKRPRSDDFVLVEMTISLGQPAELKDALLSYTVEELRLRCGVDPEDVMLVITETHRDNFSFAGGRRRPPA